MSFSLCVIITPVESVMTDPVIPCESALFPIRELSLRTNVNTVTIRAWERRYGLLKPQRTPKGHRLYSDDDVLNIEQILALMVRGVPISKVKALLEQDVQDVTADDSDTWQQPVADFVASVYSFSGQRIEALLSNRFLNYPPGLCREMLIEPAIELLQRDSHGRAAYHYLQSEIVRYVLMRLGGSKASAKGQSLMLVCGEKTAIWRLAVMAIELADANYHIQLVNQPCDVDTWLQLAKATQLDRCVVYQDGLWRDGEVELIRAALPELPRLIVCGTAPIISGIEADDRFYASPQKYIEQALAAE